MRPVPRSLRAYAFATGCVAVCTGIAEVTRPYLLPGDLAMIQLLGIVLIATRASVRVSVYASLLTILAFAFLFVPPRFALAWSDIERSTIYVGMIVVAVVISVLNGRVREGEQAARAAAFRAEALYALNLELSTASDPKHLAAITRRHLTRIMAGPVSVLLGPPECWPEELTPQSRALAEQAWSRREAARSGGARSRSVWVPLLGIQAPLGVVGVEPGSPFEETSPQGFLLSASANQLASAIDRGELALAVRRTELEAEAERLKSSLLSAVSHDLKTPVANIIAAGTMLLDRRAEIDREAEKGLLSTVVGEGERLTRLIQNLLSVVRLDSPNVELRRTPESVEEIVLATMDHFRPFSSMPSVRVDLEEDLPLVSAEPLLLQQVLMNLLENAVRYAGASSNIVIQARALDDAVAIRVADDGPGIPAEERDKVFEKFYRGRHSGKRDGGAGLGLTICRAIVRAHGGHIRAREREGGGALVEFTLPLAPIDSDGEALSSPVLAS